MNTRFPALIVLFSILPGCTATGSNGDAMKLEQAVCGFREPFVFWMWSGMAGSPDAKRVAGLRNVEDIAFETVDGRTLRGYRLHALDADGEAATPRGYLLVMQGNAILADQIIGAFAAYAAAGLDVYVYDFRGYGRSDGRRRLRAIISDYGEIIAALERAGYARHYVYAMSFGGIALLNGFPAQGRLDRIVIDSSPARLSDYGCPASFDPVNHLPADCSHCLFIAGGRDRVVTPAMSRELVEAAAERGAQVLRDASFGHPFMDSERSVHERRMRSIRDYLLADR